METDMKVNTFVVDDVKCLEMKIAAASVRTKEAAGREIRVEAKNLQEGVYTCEVKAGKLIISYKLVGMGHLHMFGQNEAQIMLYLPADMTLESAVLEIGAGKIYMDTAPILCNDMDVEIGAGKWKVSQLSISNRLNVKIGAGKAKMKEIIAGMVNIECGVGSSVYKGRIEKNVRVGCGVGNCSFQLSNKESDFNYDISCALGSVSINKNTMKGLVSKKIYKSQTALGTAVLECGLGSIEFRLGEYRCSDDAQ